MDAVADLLFCRVWLAQKELVGGKDHSRSAVPALKPVTFPKTLLQRMELLPLHQPLDGEKLPAICLDRQNRAGFHRRAVKHNRTGPTDAGLAANMGTCEPDHIPEVVNQ